MGINVLNFQNFRDHSDRRMLAFIMIMMTIKKMRNINQTIDLVSTSEEAEIMPNGGRYDKEKSITPGHSDHRKDPSGRELKR